MPAVQEQLPVEENAWPHAGSCDPAVKVRPCGSRRSQLLWAAAQGWNTDVRRRAGDTLC